MKDIKTVVDEEKNFVTDEANAVARFNEIKGQIDETGKENTAKLLVEKNSFDAVRIIEIKQGRQAGSYINYFN